MTRLLWLADVAAQAGLTVLEDPNWRTRGTAFTQPVRGVIAHHTATAASAPGDYPSLRIVRDGRSDLPGPLSQYGLGRSGAVYVIASGRANHAGPGSWPGLSGNADTIGIEAEHPGTHVAWPTAQYAAYATLCAAIVDHLDLPTSRIIGHKEWAPTRKIDPTFHMGTFRAAVEQQRHKEKPMEKIPKPGWLADAVITRLVNAGVLSVRPVLETEERWRSYAFYDRLLAAKGSASTVDHIARQGLADLRTKLRNV